MKALSADPAETIAPLPAQRWVLAGLLGAVLLNLHHTAAWCLPVALGGAVWRLWAAQHASRLMGRTARMAVVVVLTLAVLLSFRTLNGVDAGASLLVAMAALKLMETQRQRDWLIVLGSSLFLLLAACLDAQSLWRTPLYAGELWLLCTVLYALGAGSQVPPAGALLHSAGRSLLLALPFAILLFVCFPRLSGSLWSVRKEDEAVTGLGEDMSPGSISELTESDEPALRVRFDGDLPPLAERYWRGPVLHRFDGYAWHRTTAPFGPPPELEFTGRSYRYEVTLEPNKHRVLIGLEMPRAAPDEPLAYTTFDYQIMSANALNEASNYRLESYPEHRAPGGLDPAVRRLELALPRARNPRSIALAHGLRESASDDRAYVKAVLDYLEHGGFTYTLTPPRLSANSIDDLLFNTHEGFCGHYASAFATLMRAGGVPARVVTGYLGGQWNRFGGYLLIRQSNAHAWTEIWLEGPGWVRIDPTAVVAPDDLNRDLADVVAGAAGRRHLGNLPWIASALQAWQAANAWWQDEFVEFNLSKQFHLLSALGLKDHDLETLVALLAAGTTLWLSLLTWRARQRPGAGARDPLSRSWRALERALARKALERAPHEGPIAYSERVAGQRPELAAALKPLGRQYARLRYGRGGGAAQVQRFGRAVRFFTARLRR
jgi:transglutaminase-like putative cysteine protease